MRKLAWLISAALVAAVAAPALAADFHLSGSIESNLTWRQRAWAPEGTEGPKPPGVSAATSLKLSGSFGTSEQGVRAVLELSPVETEKPFEPGSQFNLGQIGIQKAYLEANGQLWQSSPPVTARIGTLDLRLSPYIATFGREGLSISGVRYGPVQAAAFVGRDARRADPDNPDSAPVGDPFTVSGAQVLVDLTAPAQMAAAMGGIPWPVSATMGLTGLHVGGHYALELTGGVSPYPGVVVSGAAAVDATGGRTGQPVSELSKAPRMTRLDVAADVIPGVTVSAGYRNVWNVFDPLYQEIVKDEDGERIDWLAENRGERGVKVGVRTAYQGITLQASLDNYTRWPVPAGQPVGPEDATFHRDAEVAAGTVVDGFEVAGSSTFDLAEGVVRKETKFSVARPIARPGLNVTPKYEATIDEMGGVAHTLSATASTDLVPYFPGLQAEGEVTRASSGSLTYKAGLSYRAPNGLTLGVHHDSAKGAWVDAGLKVEF